VARVATRTAVVFATAAILAGAVATPAAARIRPVERRMAAIVNRARVSHGVGRLPLSARMSRVARANSRQMAAAGSILHSCVVCTYGENVGAGATLRRVHRTFMGSAIHRSNILSTRYHRLGVGIVRSGGWLWVTEIFLL
jgi:uncharacterized protein YkwD